MSVAIRTSQNVLLEYEPASIGDRILATLIDYLVFLAWITLTVALPAGLNVNTSTFYVYALVVLPIFTYDLVSEWLLNGRSVGKIAMNIQVVMLDGSPPGLGAYLIRWLLRIVDVRIMQGLVAIITIAATGRGQRLGDMAAGTTVVKLKPDVALADLRGPLLTESYVVQFPDARLLNDRDLRIIREVLARGDAEVVALTASRVKDVMGIASNLPDRAFLETVVSDYQFITTQ